jgi:hypothetical protein
MCKKSRRTNKKIKCRVRTRKMRGGFTEDANIRAKLNVKLIFKNSDNVELFQNYHFGTPIRTAKWIELFDACVTNNVPIFVLTSGDKYGIIYSLQLMLLDRYIKEVLCNNPKYRRIESEYVGKTKYQIIQQEIHRPAFIPKPDITTSDGFIGYLVDDGEHNYNVWSEDSTRIKFIDSRSETFKSRQEEIATAGRAAGSDARTIKDKQSEDGAGDTDREVEENEFVPKMKRIYEEILTDGDKSLGAYNLIPISVLDMLIREAPRMSALYLDYDLTLQRNNAAPPGLLDKAVQDAFERNGAAYDIVRIK